MRAAREGGKLRALAVSSAQRAALMPQVPTLAEAGVAGYDVEVWFGVVAPAGTPKDVVAKLNGEINRILAQPEVKSRFAEQGVRVIGGPPSASPHTCARKRRSGRKWSGTRDCTWTDGRCLLLPRRGRSAASDR